MCSRRGSTPTAKVIFGVILEPVPKNAWAGFRGVMKSYKQSGERVDYLRVKIADAAVKLRRLLVDAAVDPANGAEERSRK